MNARKIRSGIVAAIVVLAVGFGVFQFRSARSLEVELNALRVERDDLHSRLDSEKRRGAETQRALGTAPEKIAGDSVKASATAGESAKSIGTILGPQMEYVFAHPELQGAFLQQQVLREKMRFERFFKAAGVSAERQEKYWKLVEEAQAASLDWMTAQYVKGMPTDPKEREQLSNLRQENVNKVAAQARELLGPEMYSRLEQLAAATPERNVADQVASQLYLTDTPLSAAQAEQLTQILHENSYRQDGSARASLGAYVPEPAVVGRALRQSMQQNGLTTSDWKAPITDAAMARAKTILSPEQFAALQQLQAWQVTQLQLAPPKPEEKK